MADRAPVPHSPAVSPSAASLPAGSSSAPSSPTPSSSVASPADPAGPREPSRWRPLAAALVVITLWVVGLWGVQPVLAAGPWRAWALGVCAAVVGGSAVGRVVRPRSRVGACLFGLVAGCAVVLALVGPTGRGGEWVDDPGAMLQQVRLDIYAGTAPLDIGGPTGDLLIVACLMASWVCALLLVGLDAIVLAGLVPASLPLAVPLVTALRAPVGAVAASGALLCVLLWVGAPPGRGVWRRLTAAAMTFGLATAAVWVLPPTQDHVWNTDAVTLAPVGSGVPDVTIALGEDLRREGNPVVLSLAGAPAGSSVRLGLAVLTDFEGGRWLPQDTLDQSTRDVSDITTPMSGVDMPTTAGAADLRTASRPITVQIRSLVSTWLPLPRGTLMVWPAAVGAGEQQLDLEDWKWVAETQTARSTAAITRPGQTYTTYGWDLDNASQFGSMPPSFWDEWPVADTNPTGQQVLADATALPGTVPESVVAAARTATASAANRMDAARELVQFFTDGSFTYDEDAPYTPGADPDDPYQTMEAFLQLRRGYCVHFASTFAVMARSLGMPTRVVVGYASRAESTTWTDVHGQDLHAWPEVFFEGIGWVSFEPTPGGAGVRADGGSSTAGDDGSAPGDSASAEPTPSAGAGDEEGAPGQGRGADAGDPGGFAGSDPEDGQASGATRAAVTAAVVVGGGLVVAGLAAVTAPVLVRRRRRHSRLAAVARGTAPARAAWAEFVDTARDLRVLPSPSDEASASPAGPGSAAPRARTPEAVVEHLAATGVLEGEGLAAARRLATAVVEESFGGGDRRVVGGAADGGAAEGDAADGDAADGDAAESLRVAAEDAADRKTADEGVAASLRVACGALAASVPRGRRRRAAFMPRSVVAGVRGNQHVFHTPLR